MCDRPSRKPRPLLEITGPARTEARPSHPSREEDWGSQDGVRNQSEEFGSSLLHGFRGPSRPNSLHVSGILCPAAGSWTGVPRKVQAKVGYVLGSALRRSSGRWSWAREPQESPSFPQPTPRFPGAVVTLPGPRLNNAWAYLLPWPAGPPCLTAAAASRAGRGLLCCVWGVVIAGVCANVSSVMRWFFKRNYGKPDKIRKKKKFFFDTRLKTPLTCAISLPRSSAKNKNKTVQVQTWNGRAGTKFAKH